MDKITILNQIKQEDIFFKYLNLSSLPLKNISSPFSEDKNPSFSIYNKDETILFKCHSTGFNGDCFQLVADLNNLDAKKDFSKVLEIICNDFNIIDDSNHFLYFKKDFSVEHLNYFLQGNWNVSHDILNKYNVSALDKFEYFNNQTKSIKNFKVFDGVIGFVYEINNNAELYIPKQDNKKVSKFYLNKMAKDDIFGFDQLNDNNKFIIISAGKKDCLILNSNNFPSVCFRSENHIPTTFQLSKLKDKCDFLFLCYDNDDSGINLANKIFKNNTDFIDGIIHFDKKYNDIADYFLLYENNDFKPFVDESINLIEANNDSNNNTIFHIVENYLSNYYDIRFNHIALEFEIRKKPYNNWDCLNEFDLFTELQKKGIKVSLNNLIYILKSSYVKKYNPIKSYFENLPIWDKKTDYINLLADHVKAVDKTQFLYHFKKWCVRTVKCSLIDNYFNKQAFILVHKAQNSGKSTFCRFLCPPELNNYIAEDLTSDKDARLLLAKNFLINLDELAALSKKEINTLKSYFSKTQINERIPYDRKNSILPRIASFIGSTNMDNFLSDETGSVRWLCFQINSIDFSYKEKINIDLVWAQAYALFKDNFNAEINIEDIKINEERNRKFQQLSNEQEIISKYILKPKTIDQGEFMTASDIIMYLSPLGIPLNNVQIGKALGALGFDKIKHSKRQVYGYMVIKEPLFDYPYNVEKDDRINFADKKKY